MLPPKPIDKIPIFWYHSETRGRGCSLIFYKEIYNMYKLIAIDLDGTLLNSFGEVSKDTRKALLEAKEKGAEIILASRKTN